MVKLGISYLIRRFFETMTSRQGCGIGLCQCRKSPFTRTAVTSCSADSGKGKVTVESRGSGSIEREGLQWDKLSEDEKNIYFAHKNACMVSPQLQFAQFVFLGCVILAYLTCFTTGYFAITAEIVWGSLANSHYQEADRRMKLQLMQTFVV